MSNSLLGQLQKANIIWSQKLGQTLLITPYWGPCDWTKHPMETEMGGIPPLKNVGQIIWIVNGMAKTKRIISPCFPLKRQNTTLGKQMMAPLSALRLFFVRRNTNQLPLGCNYERILCHKKYMTVRWSAYKPGPLIYKCLTWWPWSHSWWHYDDWSAKETSHQTHFGTADRNLLASEGITRYGDNGWIIMKSSTKSKW